MLVNWPLFSPGPQGLTPSRRALPCPGRRPQLGIVILSSLMNLCDSPVTLAEPSRMPGRAEDLPTSSHQPPLLVHRLIPLLCALPASPAHPCPSSGTTATSSPGWPPGLQRSKLNLSELFSRAAADLELFFNFCGLDSRGSTRIGGSKGQLKGWTLQLQGGCSRRSSATVEERAIESVPYVMSVIEHNARVIKWLYGLQQAHDPLATEG